MMIRLRPSPLSPRFGSRAAFALLALLGAACGGGEVEGSEEAGAPSLRSVPAERSFVRDESEAARALRRALDLGLHEEIEERLEVARPTLGAELPLLEARWLALRGKDLNVTAVIEEARAATPDDPRVYATAAELHAAAGRLETAGEELRRGLEACGNAPEFLRSQAFVELSRQGGAARGLELLERALSYDPELPFTARAQGQAHLLLAKEAMAARRPMAALVEARKSLEHDPLDLDARLFLADALAANSDFPSAVRILEELEAEGHSRGGELALMYKRAALAELVLGHRERGVEYFRLAREAGLTEEELGTGVDVLRGAAEEAMREGMTAYEQGELETARMRFEHALRLDKDLLVVHGQLAAVLFQQEEYLPAATHWRQVLDTAIEEELELPEPVHIFLAKALYAADEKRAAKAALEAYLEREPEGEWREPTEALLAELP